MVPLDAQRGGTLGWEGREHGDLPLGDKTEMQRKAYGPLPTRTKESLGFREMGSDTDSESLLSLLGARWPSMLAGRWSLGR